MTITLSRLIPLQRTRYGSSVCALTEPDEPEFDEDGRRYVFRYKTAAPPRYCIDRERLFRYMRRHALPGPVERRILRDRRNAAGFYEDIREIQTHADVEPIEVTPPPRIGNAAIYTKT